MTDLLQPLDVTDWENAGAATAGKRNKTWLRCPDDDSTWLRKERWAGRPCEPAIEVLALRLAARVGLRAAEARLCRWRGPDDTHVGIISKLFLDREREELFHGSSVLQGVNPSYDAHAKWQHTVSSVRAALEVLRPHGGGELIADFAHLCAFDAWVGNSDRHQENWAVLVSLDRSTARLAPMYDPAACLGVELQPGHALLDAARRSEKKLGQYIEACPSGFGDGVTGIPLAKVVQEVSRWPEWTNNAPAWLAAFQNGMDTFRQDLEHLEESWLPKPHQTLALLLLERRLSWLSTVHAAAATGSG